MPPRINTHFRKIAEKLWALGKGQLKINLDTLKRHQVFQASDGRWIIVVAPFPAHHNYCLNVEDKNRVEGRTSPDKLKNVYILFAKLHNEELKLIACKPWNSFDFKNIKIQTGNLGEYYFIKEKMLTNSDSLPLFDGVKDPNSEFIGLFPNDATTPIAT